MASLEESAKALIESNLERTLSPLLLTLGIDSYLMGMIGNQFFRYVTTAEREARHITILVYFAMVMAVVTTGFTWAWELHIFAFNYGKYAQFISQQWTAWHSVLCPTTKIAVQIFYAERAWRVNNRNNWILLALGVCLTTSSVCSITFAFLTYKLVTPAVGTAADILHRIWPSACILADLITTTSILWGLYQSRTGWKLTDKLIYRLMRVSVEAQIPPTIAASVVLMTWSPSLLCVPTLVGIILPKIYLTGCLSVLNSRDIIKQNSSTYHSSFFSEERSSKPQQRVTVSTNTYVESCYHTTDLPPVGLNRALAAKESCLFAGESDFGSNPTLPVTLSKEDLEIEIEKPREQV
ncbi:hypothetical protein L204_102657 [Cryptococcus depauperatus]|nr:hypothetical protein L204_00593 [Cryptococcus depauperatus CBS 7855]